MATISVPAGTWKNGFRQPAAPQTETAPYDPARPWVNPPATEIPTTTMNNDLGQNTIRFHPTLYSGTSSPDGKPAWFKPPSQVDVLIVGAGPTGLETAISLSRQNVSVRIIDKAKTLLVNGRADAVLPRYLEMLTALGISTEVSEEGPIIERTAVWKDNKILHHDRSHQSDSKFRGIHICTQGQLERIFVRDLVRHKILVERDTQMIDFSVSSDPGVSHPVTAVIKESENGQEETIHAKFLVGADGAGSNVRRKLDIPFDGVSTDIYWGILDCKFKSDYPHAWIFGGYLNSKHGSCVVVPREHGYNRFYVQMDLGDNGAYAEKVGGRVDIQSITPEDVLAQANRIFDPYKVEFDAPLSWFALWRVSERVARRFSSPDLRVHLAGDAAHVHSVFGAFGLNASMLDATNLGWKLGLCCKDKAEMSQILRTYDQERRLHACNVIELSGKYLRYTCNRWDQEVPMLHRAGEPFGEDNIELSVRGRKKGIVPPGTTVPDHLYLPDFYVRYGAFMLGLDIGYGPNPVNSKKPESDGKQECVTVDNGVRCPNPRVCWSASEAGYLYDKFRGMSQFHIILFASDLQGHVRNHLEKVSTAIEKGFYPKFGGSDSFNIILVTKALPFETQERLSNLKALREKSTIAFDDRPPDDDAHGVFKIDQDKGAILVVRPDLWIGTSMFLNEVGDLEAYFEGFWSSSKDRDFVPESITKEAKNPQSKLAGRILGGGQGELVYCTPTKMQERDGISVQ